MESTDRSSQENPLTFDSFKKFMGDNVLPQFEAVNKKFDTITSRVDANSAEIAKLKEDLTKVRTKRDATGRPLWMRMK